MEKLRRLILILFILIIPTFALAGSANRYFVVPILPTNSVIIQKNAYDLEYLNNNIKVQKYLVNLRKRNNEIYIKTNDNIIVNLYNKEIKEYLVLPNIVVYYDNKGNKIECKVIK